MTELSGTIAFLGPEQHRLAATTSPKLLQSVGQLVDDVDCRVIDQHGLKLLQARRVKLLFVGLK